MRRLACFVLALLSTTALAQQVSPDVYAHLKWRLIGPFRAGRVTAVAGVPDQPSLYYMGTPGGGVWRTTDGGQVWEPISDQVPVASIGDLAVSPSNPKVIYAGTGEQTIGNGVYKSTDAGATWAGAGLAETHYINSVLVDPRNPDVVLVGAAGDFQPGPARGVFKSTDGGRSWTKTLFRDDASAVMDMCFDPDNPQTVYAAIARRGGPGGPPAAVGAPQQNGWIYKSTDEGSTWSLVGEQGLPEAPRGRIGVAVAPGTSGRRVFAIVAQGLFRSEDGGQTWTRSTTDPRVIGSGYFSRVFVDPRNPAHVYVAQTAMYRSTDGGRTFDAFYGAPSGDDIHTMWINPRDDRYMILGVDQGAIVSENAGRTWSSWYNQATGQFYHVSTDNQFPYTVYAAQQDSGSIASLSRSDYGEITFRDWFSPGAFEVAHIAADPLHPDLIYGTGWYGSLIRFDKRTGQIVHVFVRSEKYRTGTEGPVAFSQDGRTLYLGAQMLLKTTDGGMTWQSVSPDLTRGMPAPGTRGPRGGHFLSALSLSSARPGMIWTGSQDGLVQMTADNGAHWQNVTPTGLPENSAVLTVEASHFDGASAYIVAVRMRDARPYILRTHDAGKSWQMAVQGLPESTIVRVVREDPVHKGLLYAGTETGVYCSFDDGDHWQPLQLNLPTASVRDLAVHGDDLVAATFGRSIWILDDLSPLRQFDAAVSASPAFLFKPAAAIRARWDVNQDTPLPRETPVGQNPPDGAILNYFLPSAPAGEITLDIFDARHNLVRHFSSTPPPPPTRFLPNAPTWWFAPAAVLPTAPGVNRLVWNLRYPPAAVLPYSYFGNLLEYFEYTLADHAIPGETPVDQPMAPLAAPGEYQAVLTVAGRKYTQPLTVKPDPRVNVSPQDFAAQLAEELKIHAALQVTSDVFTQAAALRSALADRRKTLGSANASLADALKKLNDAIAAAQDGTPAEPGVGPLNRELARLAFMVGSGDGRPSESAAESVNALCQGLVKGLARWRELNTATLPAVNSQLQQQRLEALPVAPNLPSAGACGP